MWAMTGKQCWRCGVLREPIYRSQVLAHTQIPQRVLLALDSRTVAMKVGIRWGVCNNSPAEASSPKNGWCPSQWVSIPSQSAVAVEGSPGKSRASSCRKGMRDRCSGWVCPQLERPLEQILVVVASTPSSEGRQTQLRCVRLRTGVEQVSTPNSRWMWVNRPWAKW